MKPTKEKKSLIIVSSSYPTDKNPLSGPIVPIYAENFVKLGYAVHILIPRRTGEPVPVKGALIHQYGPANLTRSFTSFNILNPLELIHAIRFIIDGERALIQLSRKIKIPTILALWAIPSGWYAFRTKLKLGIPYAVLCLGSDIHTWPKYPIIGSMIKAVLRNAEFRYTDGFELGRLAEKISKKKFLFFPTTLVSGMKLLNKPELNSREPYRFLFAGRLEKVKGADLIIPAFALARKKTTRPMTLTIIGNGSLADRMKAQVISGGLQDEITFTGQLTPGEVQKWMQHCRCLLIPSRKESIPMVFSEALLYGMRIILCNAKGSDMASLAQKHGVARICRKENVTDIGNGMSHFAQGKETWSQTGRKKVLDLFDIQEACKNFKLQNPAIQIEQPG